MIRQPSRKLVLFLLIGLLLFTACKKPNDSASLRPAPSEDEDRSSEEVTSSSASPLFPKPDSGKEEDPGESLRGEKEGENFRREFLVCLDPGHSAHAFLRLHCDGSDNPRAKGAMAVTISPGNPYHPENYRASQQLGQALVREYTRATGLVARKSWTTDTMTGLNWAESPAVLFEMGFLSNPEEDLLLQDHEFREKMVQGLADGLDDYFGEGTDARKEKEDKDE